jgi:NAD(P)-dependent dehydrogenase (short-subunit alcohol dehydrogenase family)
MDENNFFNSVFRKLAGKTIYITGASRGIGERIGLKCAQDGANVKNK